MLSLIENLMENSMKLTAKEIIEKSKNGIVNLAALQFTYEDIIEINDNLKNGTSITSLNLANNGMSIFDIQGVFDTLKQNTSLTSLRLSATPMYTEGAESLANMLRANSTLTQLDLDTTRINDQYTNDQHINHEPFSFNSIEIEVVLDALRRGEVNFSLNKNKSINPKPEGLSIILDSLNNNSTLTSLAITFDTLGLHEVKVFSPVFKHNSNLISLNLKGTYSGDKRLLKLLESLEENHALTNLNLSYNDLERIGIDALSRSLIKNTSLMILNLRGNLIGDEGIYEIAESLKINSSLTSLDLAANKFRDEGVYKVAESLKINSTLTSLDIAVNGFTDEGGKKLYESLLQNEAVAFLNMKENSLISSMEGQFKELPNLLQLNGKCLKNQKYDYIKKLVEYIKSGKYPSYDANLGNSPTLEEAGEVLTELSNIPTEQLTIVLRNLRINPDKFFNHLDKLIANNPFCGIGIQGIYCFSNLKDDEGNQILFPIEVVQIIGGYSLNAIVNFGPTTEVTFPNPITDIQIPNLTVDTIGNADTINEI